MLWTSVRWSCLMCCFSTTIIPHLNVHLFNVFFLCVYFKTRYKESWTKLRDAGYELRLDAIPFQAAKTSGDIFSDVRVILSCAFFCCHLSGQSKWALYYFTSSKNTKSSLRSQRVRWLVWKDYKMTLTLPTQCMPPSYTVMWVQNFFLYIYLNIWISEWRLTDLTHAHFID